MFPHITPIIKRNLFLLFVLMSVALHAQQQQKDTLAPMVRPFLVSYGFSQPVSGKVLPQSGVMADFGINIPGCFKKKWILGLFVEWRIFKYFGSNRKYGNIRRDINEAINFNQPDARDSARVLFLHDAFNSNADRHFRGSNAYRYGIVFSPFPDTLGGFLLALKRGKNDFPVSGAYAYYDVVKYESESYLYLSVPVDFSVELTSKPFLFITKRRLGRHETFIRNCIFLSVFWDRISMKRAEFNGASLSNFLVPAFFEKNGTDNHFGFKVSFGLY